MKQLFKLTGILLLAVLVALSLLDGSSFTIDSKWITFLGRFHPVLLHLPIGLFAGVVLLEIYMLVRPGNGISDKIGFLLNVSFYATVFSALFGIFISWEGGYDGDAVGFHKWAGVVTAGLIFALSWSAGYRERNTGRIAVIHAVGLVATSVAISITGHKGGSLTHGSNFLTEHNPFGTEAVGIEFTIDTPVFESHIQPVLKDYCYQCHSSEKIKGELRLDSFEYIMAGGVTGPVLIPGDSDGSDLLKAIHLPIDEDEHMPPKGKPQPNEDTINLLAWWINEGGSETATLEQLNVTAEVASHFLEVDVLEFQSRKAVEILLQTTETNGAVGIYFLAQKDFRLGGRGGKATDADLEKLLPLKSNIIELNFGKSEVTDAGLEAIGQMTNLTHLHLNKTAITDAGLEQLTNLYQLEYLNLYGTNITDVGLLALRPLKNLKKVFLWETDVSQEAVADLHHSVFDAVESENIRLQIQELSKKRARLKVDIASGFDPELQEPIDVDDYQEPEFSISDFMVENHKGKNSLAAQTREGRADRDRVRVMVNQYRIMANVTPPKGSVEDWKKRVEELVESGNFFFLSGGPESVERYNLAVDCIACHTIHRAD